MRANVKRSTTARKQRANDVAFTVRFIADQIRELCMDNSGRMSYIEDMDDVMKDLTGVRSFAQRLVMSRTVEQFVNVVQQVGVAVVLDLLHDQNLFEAMRQMVLVSSRIRYLKKACKKVDRKLQECDRANPKREKYRKQLKDFAHEYKYLRKLYKRAILTMQSMLGVQTGTTFGDYEEQFSFLKSFADKGGRRRFDEFDFVDDFGLMDDPILDDIGGGHSYGRERRRGRNPIDELAGFGHDLRSNYRIEDMDEFVSVDDDDDDNYHGPDSDDLLSGINRLNANMDRMLTIMMSNGSFTPAKAPEPEPLIKDPNNASIGDLANAFNNFGSSIDRRMTKVEDQVVQMSNVIVSLKDDSDTVYTRE